MDLFEYALQSQNINEKLDLNKKEELWKKHNFSFVNTLDELKEITLHCKKCKLHTTRKNVVFGEGDENAKLMFIGEGPGKTEDETGRPFIGKAGELLTRIIEKGLKIPREKVYIANVVKCRPTVDLRGEKDRPPEADEVEACSPFLIRQIEIINPKVIVSLGNPASKFLLNTSLGITKIRGQTFTYRSSIVIPTYHPSFILRNGGDASPYKKEIWEDMKKVLEILNT